jgi:hypothetical protein
LSSHNLVFDPKDSDAGVPFVEIIMARLGRPIRAEDKQGYRLYAIEDWVYCVSGSSDKNRAAPWAELKTRMERNHQIDGAVIIDIADFRGSKESTVSLDAATDEGLYYIFQHIDQGITNETIKMVRAYLAAAGKIVDMIRLTPDSAVDYAILQYRSKGYSDGWIQKRLKGKITHRQFMDALTFAVMSFLKKLNSKHYQIATNTVYAGLWGRTTEVLREQLSISDNQRAKLRDYFPEMALSYLEIAENFCTLKLKDTEILSFDEAAQLIFEVATLIGKQVRMMDEALGYDMVTGLERLPDDDIWHEMIEDGNQRTINDDGWFIDKPRKKPQLSKGDD